MIAEETAAAAPEQTAVTLGRGPPILQAILKRSPSPRASPRGTPAAPAEAILAQTTALPKLTPKAPPAHLVLERAAQLAASTATFGSTGSDRVVRDATLEEAAAFAPPAAVVIHDADEPMPLLASPLLADPNVITIDASIIAGMVAQMEDMKERIMVQAAAGHQAELNRAAEAAQYEHQLSIVAASAAEKQRVCEELQAQVLHSQEAMDGMAFVTVSYRSHRQRRASRRSTETSSSRQLHSRLAKGPSTNCRCKCRC